METFMDEHKCEKKKYRHPLASKTFVAEKGIKTMA